MSAERERLTALAAAAGYESDVLAIIAGATLPAYQPGDRLTDPEIRQVADSVEMLAQAGLRGDALPGIVAHYQRRYGPTGATGSGASSCAPPTCATTTPSATDHRPASRADRLTPATAGSTSPARHARRHARHASAAGARVAEGACGRRVRYVHNQKGTPVMHDTFTARYQHGLSQTGGRCPIEAGVAGRLADHECHCGRLPYDRTPPCGCWPQEPAAIVTLPAPPAATAPAVRRREAA